MARMLGTFGRPRCPRCRTASGPDCADASRGKGGQRKAEERHWRRDWNQDVYDAMRERYDMETLHRMISNVWPGTATEYLDHYYDSRPIWAHPLVG